MFFSMSELFNYCSIVYKKNAHSISYFITNYLNTESQYQYLLEKKLLPNPVPCNLSKKAILQTFYKYKNNRKISLCYFRYSVD